MQSNNNNKGNPPLQQNQPPLTQQQQIPTGYPVAQGYPVYQPNQQYPMPQQYQPMGQPYHQMQQQQMMGPPPYQQPGYYPPPMGQQHFMPYPMPQQNYSYPQQQPAVYMPHPMMQQPMVQPQQVVIHTHTTTSHQPWGMAIPSHLPKISANPHCHKCRGTGYKYKKGHWKPCKHCMHRMGNLFKCGKCAGSGYKLKNGKRCKCLDLLSAFGLSQKKINTILQKDGVDRLAELLCEEETVTECKQQNQKLLEFLCKKENLTQLIKYATRNPENPDNNDQAYKQYIIAINQDQYRFPFVATDILTSCMRIADSLVATKDTQSENASPNVKKQNGSNSSRNRVETDEDETSAVQKMLQKVKDEQDKTQTNAEGEQVQKEMLVEDLNGEIDLEDDDDFDSKLNAQENNQEGDESSKKGTRTSFTGKDAKTSINVEDDDEDEEVNVEEDHEENNAKARQKFNIQISNMNTNKTKLSPSSEESVNYDFTLLDQLFGFLDQEDEIQPILCGYFNKIVQALLGKIKQKMLNYLFIYREGDIYSKLMNHLEHHSLAQLMVELLQVKIVQQQARDRFSSDFDKEDKHEEDSDEEKQGPPLTPTEQKMTDVLIKMKQEVVYKLIQRLCAQNKDLDLCLNAHAILLELADNEQTYGKLVEKDNLTLLIKAACDLKNPNQAYALNILITISKEFPDYERQIGTALATEFQQVIGHHFLDLTYSCIMVLRSSDRILGETLNHIDNQSGVQHKRFGLKRLRAIEFLRQELQTLSKYVELNSDQYISNVLRRQIINAMLDVIEEYEFCSIANQQAMLVLDFLKNAFDDEELELLKDFVKRNLKTKAFINFESGRQTTNGNLATIIKMALVLKKITIEGHLQSEDEKNEDYQNQITFSRNLQHLNDQQWIDFCNKELNYFETKWTKKLEDYGQDKEEIDPDTKQIEVKEETEEEKEQSLSKMLALGSRKQNMIKQRNKSAQFQEHEQLEKGGSSEEQKKPKDDWNHDFTANNYWKVPEQYSIDDLLEEDGMPQ